MEKNKCSVRGCVNEGRYCRLHANLVIKKVPEIKKESDKRREINRKEYAPKAKAFVQTHPKCQAAIEGICDGPSKCVHHKKGKHSKEDLLDEKFWLAVCFSCHAAIEASPLWAKQMGFSVSRLSKTSSK